MYARQQVLHSIVAEGHQMLTDGTVDNRVQFEHKLHLLEEQWHSVVKRANQRKALIDNMVSNWNSYNMQLERLHEKLGEVETSIHMQPIENPSLQQVKSMLHQCKVSIIL